MRRNWWVRTALAAGVVFMLASGGVTVAHAYGPTIGTVTFSGSASNPTITITGMGFGSTAPTVTQPNPAGFTGNDYAPGMLQLDDSTNGFEAGAAGGTHFDYIGLVNLTYLDTQVQYQFGSAYPTYGSLVVGDTFTVSVQGVTCSGTVSYITPTTCTSSGGGSGSGAATPELGSGELLATGVLPIGAVLLYRRRRARRATQQQ